MRVAHDARVELVDDDGVESRWRHGARTTDEGRRATPLTLKRPCGVGFPGNELSSHQVAPAVLSPLTSLTTVFGMGTGVASSLESPGNPTLQGVAKLQCCRSNDIKPSTVSTALLNGSHRLHIPPINQLISLGSYLVNPVGGLILRWASHLDAFSAYPVRT